jgi:hypothetical protein
MWAFIVFFEFLWGEMGTNRERWGEIGRDGER